MHRATIFPVLLSLWPAVYLLGLKGDELLDTATTLLNALPVLGLPAALAAPCPAPFWLATACGLLGVWFPVFVLFGAPLFEYAVLGRTLLCAGLMAGMSAGWVGARLWRTRFVRGEAEPARMAVMAGGAVGSAVGAWVSAWSIPLDWDRPWQVWPVPIVYGSTIGYAVGSFVGVASHLLRK